jgi:glycosyltransferase involved in cell wall biosynthesis
MKPLVSILIPLYNHEKYIVRCLDSVLEDTYVPKEVVIVDDGSKDGSARLVQDWISRHAHHSGLTVRFTSRPNQGLCATLNELVTSARGEYLAIVASDDFLLPGGIATRVEHLRRHPGKLAVFGDCIVVDNDNVKTRDSGLRDLYRARKAQLLDERTISHELVMKWSVPGPVFMAHRDAYKTVGLYDTSLLVEDRDFYLRLLARNLLCFVDAPVAAYRLHGLNSIQQPGASQRLRPSLHAAVKNNLDSFSGIRRLYLTGQMIWMSEEFAACPKGSWKYIWHKCRSKTYKLIAKTLYSLWRRSLPKSDPEIHKLSTVRQTPSHRAMVDAA